MYELIHHLPIATTVFSIVFAWQLARHYARKQDAKYLLWWTIGVITYGLGTLTESINTLMGWSELNFRLWYALGALMGGAPLAQGTVYLLMKKRVADALATGLVVVVTIATVCVFLSPVDAAMAADGRLSGNVFAWQWVRLFSPFINTYAFVFLFGGAVYSAWKYYQNRAMKRFLGNVFIAIGALLPGIGGSLTRFGMVEALYVTELVGILCIYTGYQIMRRDRTVSPHRSQQEDSTPASDPRSMARQPVTD